MRLNVGPVLVLNNPPAQPRVRHLGHERDEGGVALRLVVAHQDHVITRVQLPLDLSKPLGVAAQVEIESKV